MSEYADTAYWDITGYTAVKITCGFLSTQEINPLGERGQFGVGVSHDGPNMALIAGAHYSENDDDFEMFSYHDLSPTQARELADSLNEVADAVEAARQVEAQRDESDEPEAESFLRRLLNR